MSDPERPVLELRELTKEFRVPKRGAFALGHHTNRAVDGVSLALHRGEILALVGESGSGKSTTAKMAVGLLRPDRGSVLLDGVDVAEMSRRTVRRSFRPKVQVVFQDPGASLNPRMRVGTILAGPLLLHRTVPQQEVRAEVHRLLASVDLDPVEEFAARFPHELSGGQQQRVAIARALSLRPQVVIADEPVSALDVSIRAQVLELLLRNQRELGIGLLIITHDLAVVRAIAPKVAVMYHGKIVESGDTDEIFVNPHHPYTQRLLAASPHPDPAKASLIDKAAPSAH